MIKYMLLFLCAGFLSGRLGLFEILIPSGSMIILVCLCFMTFLASVEIGKKDFLSEIKKAGICIVLYAFGTIAGTLLAAALVSVVLPLSTKDCLIAASGMGWYSLATGLVFPYSAALSVVTFVSCLLRELSAMFFMPILWRRFKAPEIISIAGSAAMNPSIAAATITGDQKLVFYGMINGTIVSIFVPVLIPFMLTI
ncbi:MAG: lysine exporter LysO family protein [Clostridia bacterium]|nr:lysine exporter LysO family protein [Clostridia bacterium]